jgi:ubiquinone/menaquinone biosynthesis C-methylase UbiE
MITTSFRSRSTETERLDRGEFSEAEYRRWQKEMWYIHRFFGEIRALRNTLVDEIERTKENSLSVLEVAAGSGGLLAYLNERVHQKQLTRIGLEISADSVSLIAKNGSIAVRGNGLQLPFADKSVDFAFSTLFLHHLDERNASQLIREMHRVVRRKLFIIDLDRRALPYLLYRSLGTLLLQRFTRDDGALSIKRAYRACELERIAESAGLQRFTISTSAINRLVLSADG